MTQTLTTNFEVKALDESGHFEGYASVFDRIDEGRDIVVPGAFKKSLEERGSDGIKLLWQHDPSEPIGKIEEIYEDKHGLYVKGRLLLNLQRAREALTLMQDQAMDTINFSYAPFNINSEKFLIIDWSLHFTKDDEGNVGLLVHETLSQEEDAIYNWVAVSDEADVSDCVAAKTGKRINDQRALPAVNVGGGMVSVSSNPLSAVDAGATARIDVAQHDRHYGFGTVTYNSGSVTGLAFSTLFYVFTDDPNLTGGSVVYQASSVKTDTTDANGRIYIGEVTTPADGAGPTTGIGGGGFLD